MAASLCTFPMRHFASVLVVVCLAASADEGTNRKPVLQESFEEGLNSWTTYNIKHVESAEAAHSGRYCCTSYLPRYERFGRLRRKLTLKPGAEYELSFWARSEVKSSGWVWLDRDNSLYEREIHQVGPIPSEWTEYRVKFRAWKAQTLLDIDVPHSWHRKNLGRAWIDDIRVRRTDSALAQRPRPWTEERLRPGEAAFDPDGACDDNPALANDEAGTVYLAWLRSGKGRHSIAIRHFDGREWSGRVDLTDRPCKRFPPALAGTERGVWAAWAEESPQGWNALARHYRPGRKSGLIRVAGGTGNNFDVAVTVDAEGNPWFAWVTTRNKQFDLAVKKYDVKTQRWRREIVLSDHTGNGQYPTLAVDHRGTVWAAWSAFVEGAMQLWVQKVGGTAGIGKPQRITLWEGDNTHPCFAAGPDRLWLVWNTSSRRHPVEDKALKYGGTRDKVVAVACTDGTTWFLPPGWGQEEVPRGLMKVNEKGLILKRRSGFEMPGIIIAQSGAPLVLCRRYLPAGVQIGPGRYGSRGHWDAFGVLLGVNGWQRVNMPFEHGGRAETLGAVADDSGNIWVAQQQDNRDVGGYFQWFDGNLWIAARRLSSLKGDIQWRAALRPAPNLAVAEKVTPPRPRPRPSISYRGKTYKLYWGDLHMHTDMSFCGRIMNGYPDDNYKFAHYAGGLDFGALTDHGKHMNDHDWSIQRSVTSANNVPGRFVTFSAIEWTSQIVGHKNIIYRDMDGPLYDAVHELPLDLWAILRPGHAITIPHHPADPQHPSDWDYHDPRFQKVAEIYQGRGSSEYRGAPGNPERMSIKGSFVRDALNRGYRMGIIGSPDHRGTFGTAAVYAAELTREAIFESILARRCYGAVEPTAFLDVRVDGHFMGEVIAAEPRRRPHSIAVHVETEDPIDSLTLLRNGYPLHEFKVSGRKADVEFSDRRPDEAPVIGDPPQKTVYYYVRVVESNEGKRQHIAWSSPVWISLEMEPKGRSSHKVWEP